MILIQFHHLVSHTLILAHIKLPVIIYHIIFVKIGWFLLIIGRIPVVTLILLFPHCDGLLHRLDSWEFVSYALKELLSGGEIFLIGGVVNGIEGLIPCWRACSSARGGFSRVRVASSRLDNVLWLIELLELSAYSALSLPIDKWYLKAVCDINSLAFVTWLI